MHYIWWWHIVVDGQQNQKLKWNVMMKCKLVIMKCKLFQNIEMQCLRKYKFAGGSFWSINIQDTVYVKTIRCFTTIHCLLMRQWGKSPTVYRKPRWLSSCSPQSTEDSLEGHESPWWQQNNMLTLTENSKTSSVRWS